MLTSGCEDPAPPAIADRLFEAFVAVLLECFVQLLQAGNVEVQLGFARAAILMQIYLVYPGFCGFVMICHHTPFTGTEPKGSAQLLQILGRWLSLIDTWGCHVLD